MRLGYHLRELSLIFVPPIAALTVVIAWVYVSMILGNELGILAGLAVFALGEVFLPFVAAYYVYMGLARILRPDD